MTKFGMAIDLRRCAGCGACVVACQMQNNQRPGVSWNNLDECEWGRAVGESGRAYVPHACMHCDNPPCVDACPTGASVRHDNGITVVDYDSCIACGLCLSACPYGARELNTADTYLFEQAAPAPYEAYGDQRTYVAEKCIFCEGRLEEGKLPACVVNCPGRARYFGDLDDPNSDVSIFIAQDGVVRIDETSFYYRPVDGMPESGLPYADTLLAETGTRADGNMPLVAGIGIAAVAVGAGVGVAVSKSKKAVAEEGKAGA